MCFDMGQDFEIYRDKYMSVVGIFYMGAVFPNLFLRVEFLLKFLGIIVNQSNLTRIRESFSY